MCDGPEQFNADDELFNLRERFVSYFAHFVMEAVCLGKRVCVGEFSVCHVCVHVYMDPCEPSSLFRFSLYTSNIFGDPSHMHTQHTTLDKEVDL